MTNNTRRYPRTMKEAFGPYTDSRLEPMQPLPRGRWATPLVSLLAVLATLYLVFGGGNA